MLRPSSFRSCSPLFVLPALALSFLTLPGTAEAAPPQDFCVTQMNAGGHSGVPNTLPGGKTPNWWDPGAPPEFEDQRWVGASARTYHQSATDVGFVRSLWDASTQELYVWFRMDGGFATSTTGITNPKDYAIISVSPDGTDANRVYVLVQPLVSQCNDFATGTLCPGGTSIAAADVKFMEASTAVPSGYDWVDAATMAGKGYEVTNPWVWATMTPVGSPSSEYTWDVKLVLKMPAPASGAQVFFDTLMTLQDPASPSPTNPLFIEWPFPRNKTSAPTANGVEEAINNADPVDDDLRGALPTAELGGFSVGAPCTDGLRVANRSTDLGTDFNGSGAPAVAADAVGTRIRKGAGETTEFRVFATNDSTLAVAPGQLGATFYFANWGVSAPGLTQWQKLNTTPVTNASSIGLGARGLVGAEWTVPSGYDGQDHQCVQVQLESVNANLDIASQGAWRNLNFATASAFVDQAEVSTVGLPDAEEGYRIWLVLDRDELPSPEVCRKHKGQIDGCDNGQGKRFVLLSADEAQNVEKLRAAAYAKFLDEVGSKKGKKQLKAAKGAVGGKGVRGLGPYGSQIGPASFPVGVEGATTPEELPTVGINAYIETKATLDIDGTKHRHLRPYSGFGYFVEHKGDLEGWEVGLLGNEGELVKVHEGLYYVDLEANQVATIAPVIRAIDGETKPCAADPKGPGCALGEPLPAIARREPKPVECGPKDTRKECLEGNTEPGREQGPPEVEAKPKGCDCSAPSEAPGRGLGVAALALLGLASWRRRRRRGRGVDGAHAN